MTELFFMFGAIALACFGVWFFAPSVTMTEAEQARADAAAFTDMLRRRSVTHGERVAARRKYNC